MKNKWGGKRKGAGRPKPKEPKMVFSFRLPIGMVKSIKGNKTQFVIEAIKAHLAAKY